MADHGRHLFDAEKGYYVTQLNDNEFVIDQDGEVVAHLNAEEFEQFRTEGPNPRSLQ
jgi:hypothetical protein